MKNQQENSHKTILQSSAETGISRRQFLKTPAAIAAASLIFPSALGSAI